MMERTVESPLGSLVIVEQEGVITGLRWGRGGAAQTPTLDAAAAQLEAYFAGQLERFDVPMRVEGSAFQQAVCDAMRAIPIGETRTYGDIARDLGAMPQAVGQACGGNPIPILIPCHRVMGAGGKLTGFSGAGGVETKVWLLRHERAGGLLI